MPTAKEPGGHEYRCNACGRYFDTQEELDAHAVRCRASKQATESGRETLEREDSKTHEPDDRDKKGGPRGAP